MALVLNGSSNTIGGVAVGGLPDGIVDTDMIAANAVTAAKASGRINGITQADEWRVTASFNTSNANIITTNWARNSTNFSVLGSGMSESSGIFTFPATGIYKIEFNTMTKSYNQQVKYVVGEIITTSNNFSSEGSAGFASQSFSNDDDANVTVNISCLFDVTNTSTHKCKFTVYSEHSITWEGDSSRNRTYATFIRLGDT
tara:strand:+ start:6710 stop:7309 length:600 start_codon:yes stop_codon:yes gene_type:complete